MRSVFCITTCMVIATITTFCLARPKKEKKPKQNTPYVIKNETESDDGSQQDMLLSDHIYRPNPVVMAGVGAIMNGALQIAQDPHNRPNLGHSIASMVHGIITIVIEKMAKRNVDINDPQAIEECLRELSLDLGEEITELIITKQLLP
jgi:hypothetical protein